MLCGTYPDRSGFLTCFCLAWTMSGAYGVVTSDGNLRCDLHPRWSRSGRPVSVDYCERRMAILDMSEMIDELKGSSFASGKQA